MVSQSSRTEVVKKIRETGQVTRMIEGPQLLAMKKIVQTVRDEPETKSPEAEGENELEKDRIVESDVGCADGSMEVKSRRTRTSQGKPNENEQSWRTSNSAGRQSKENKASKEQRDEEMLKKQVYVERTDAKVVVLDVRLS